MKPLALTPMLLLFLGACSAGMGVTYPSLAPRAVEKAGFEEPAAPAPTPVAADPALDRRIADLSAQLVTLAKGFDADAAKAERLAAAARGRGVGSEPWLDAQAAIASLDDWHAQASALVTDAEQLAIDRAAALAPDYPGLAALRTRLDAEATRQGTAIQRLAAALPAA